MDTCKAYYFAPIGVSNNELGLKMSEVEHKYNPYIENGEKVLCQSLVAFIDILGFGERVKDAEKNGKSQEFFMSFQENLSCYLHTLLTNDLGKGLRELSYECGNDDFENQKDNYVIRLFSDCILIGCPIGKDCLAGKSVAVRDNFHQILDALCLFQAQMTLDGFFFRGAISVGELYMDDTIIYGKALIDAYEAERDEAKYPRIILTESARELFLEINEDFERENSVNWLNSYLYKDSDGKFFVNYLKSILGGNDFYDLVYWLEDHQHIVEKNLAENKDNACNLEKYKWVAKYHNLFCNQLPYHKDYLIDLTRNS
jgi:hypothetical protein